MSYFVTRCYVIYQNIKGRFYMMLRVYCIDVKYTIGIQYLPPAPWVAPCSAPISRLYTLGSSQHLPISPAYVG
jgi:hypothetical protein